MSLKPVENRYGLVVYIWELFLTFLRSFLIAGFAIIIFCVTLLWLNLVAVMRAMMSLLNHITFGLTVLAGIGLFSGLDKLVNIFLLLALMVLTNYYNQLSVAVSNPALNVGAFLNRSGSLAGNERVRRGLAILINLGAVFICAFALFKLSQLSLGLNLSVFESLERQGLYLSVSLALVFFAVFSMRTLQESNIADPAVQWFRALCYFSLCHAAVFALSIFLR